MSGVGLKSKTPAKLMRLMIYRMFVTVLVLFT